MNKDTSVVDRLAQIISDFHGHVGKPWDSDRNLADAIVDSGFLYGLEDEAYLRGYNTACAECGGRRTVNEYGEPCWICGKLDYEPAPAPTEAQIAAFEALRQLELEEGIE